MTRRSSAFIVTLTLVIGGSSFALAQTSPPASKPPAATTSRDPGAPKSGANSFTEKQARSRIEKAGYTKISGLKKDDQGIWRATATKSGKQVSVSLDFRGNVTSS
jgi:hypothetical protein